MKELFKIKDLIFYKEDFLDDISEFEDILPIIREFSDNLNYEKIKVAGSNECCEKTKENYFIEIHGYINQDDDFITKEELDKMPIAIDRSELDLFVIRIYKCTKCNKWLIDILE
ncbi:hypothetical protein FDC58_08585 [Clostridium botulinum]|uniref:DUF3785 domain-containing protein n=2 Tax=Clostridium TaxID=1485 RepID=B2TI34_CLOBB|nr:MULTISPECIES: hypothetical protein [Clostridium]ACD22043.1 conserved hypothetical protein [Clostridium botulinum B str. Eklund 17B (NRP)]AIY79394.1 hypothetical protein U728_403 [Clostridium botulinum 202F]KAI3345791.1 hypothetical protein CIT17_12040 [Clostridium botulinum]KFX54978.1 hypothetical protein KU40_12350 [Clostridium botulinum]KON12183.1 hypothetical protein ACP50_09595 [Clostridium botulinum]